MKILLADDSEFILENLVKLLKTIKKVDEIEIAKDVSETINKLEEFTPDVLVLDIKMPGGMGFDVLEIAKNSNNPPLVIMLTNYDLEQYRQRSLNAGADYFFDKSNEFEKVIDTIETYQK